MLRTAAEGSIQSTPKHDFHHVLDRIIFIKLAQNDLADLISIKLAAFVLRPISWLKNECVSMMLIEGREEGMS